MKYVKFDDTGTLVARYDSEIHGDNIPVDAVEFSDELFWQTINENDGVWKRDPKTGEIAKHPFPPAPPYVPEQVSRAQGKAALIQAGLWQAVLDYVDSITDPTEKALADVALNATTHWNHNSPFLNAAAQALGLTSEQLDDLFIQAAGIEL